MKKLFILAFVFIVMNVQAQTNVETLLDSTQQILVNELTDGCKITNYRYGTKDKHSCPVFIDEEGFFWYYDIIDNKLQIVSLFKYLTDVD